MKIDLSSEISFKTSRSGGKGGQNVNKVETAVEGYFDIMNSTLLNEEQQKTVCRRLKNHLVGENILQIKSQSQRTQQANKRIVINKINELVTVALKPVKKRIATRPGKAAKENRLQAKKRLSEKKQQRRDPLE